MGRNNKKTNKQNHNKDSASSYGAMLSNLNSSIVTATRVAARVLKPVSFFCGLGTVAANQTHYVEQPILVQLNGTDKFIAATFRYYTDAFHLKARFYCPGIPAQITALFQKQECAMLDPTNGSTVDYNYLNGAAFTSCNAYNDTTGVFPDLTFSGNFELWDNVSECFVKLGNDACNLFNQLQAGQQQRDATLVGSGIAALGLLTVGAATAGFCLYKKYNKKSNYDALENQQVESDKSDENDALNQSRHDEAAGSENQEPGVNNPGVSGYQSH